MEQKLLKQESGSGLEQKSDGDLVESKPEQKAVEEDFVKNFSKFSKYDDSDFPYHVKSGNFEYKNEAYRLLEAQIQIYREKSRNLSVYDAIARPPRSHLILVGGVTPHVISYDDPILQGYSKLALDYYREKNNNQGPTFVFHGLVKCTHALINGRIFYITFTAKAEDDLSDTPALTTFQAEVCCARDKQPEIRECAIKI